MKTTKTIPLLLLSSALAACSGRDAEADALLAQSHKVTFQTVMDLGPHRVESTRVTTDPASGTREMESTEISWADANNFLIRQARDAEILKEIRVLKGKPWVRSGDHFERREDPELYRGTLSQTWDLWGLTLEPIAPYIQYQFDKEEVVEGRKARRYTLRLATAEELEKLHTEAPPERAARFIPKEVTGSMVLDETTAVRLIAELDAKLVSRTGERERILHYQETRSGIGERPVIPPPEQRKK